MDTPTTPETPLPVPLRFSPIRIEIAKMLKLVAPISMSAEAQAVWINAAIDALEDIRPEEVQAVSAEIRRSVTRPAQIVPEIARLVAERRQRRSAGPADERSAKLYQIHSEYDARWHKARNSREVGEAQEWEREALLAAGFPVRPIAPPLTRAELDALPHDTVAMGLTGGFLERRNGQLFERA